VQILSYGNSFTHGLHDNGTDEESNPENKTYDDPDALKLDFLFMDMKPFLQQGSFHKQSL